MLPRQVLERADQPGHAAVGERHAPLLARLALEAELQRAAIDLDMAVAQRGEAEALVVAGIGGIADADEAVVEQPDGGGDHTLIGETAAAQVALDLLAKERQRFGEADESLELGAAAVLRPVGMIAILLAAALVATGRLQVPLPVLADPDIGPGRRNGEAADARQGLGIGPVAGGRGVGKTGAAALAEIAIVLVAGKAERRREGDLVGPHPVSQQLG